MMGLAASRTKEDERESKRYSDPYFSRENFRFKSTKGGVAIMSDASSLSFSNETSDIITAG